MRLVVVLEAAVGECLVDEYRACVLYGREMKGIGLR